MQLSKLHPNAGAKKVSRRVGRGEASGAGKTCGKGHKGAKARSGYSTKRRFEGGQMPLYRRLPKGGFRSRKRIFGENVYLLANLSTLERYENGAVVEEQTLIDLLRSGGKRRAGIKILGGGALTKKLTVRVHAVTEAAKNKIEALGGSVELI